jgi:hypothetical protein
MEQGCAAVDDGQRETALVQAESGQSEKESRREEERQERKNNFTA